MGTRVIRNVLCSADEGQQLCARRVLFAPV